jgi:hypothetical protein
METKLILGDNNKELVKIFTEGIKAQAIFADCIYESENFDWAFICQSLLKDTGVFILMTDYHTVAEWKCHLDFLFGKENLVNWISVLFDWGGRGRRCFAKKTDFILIYSKGNSYKFYPERVLIPKKTAGTKLDKKGTGLKIPTDFWDDMSFSTLAKERVKDSSHEKNIQWQKSLKLMNRLLLPFTDEGDLIIDPFLGSGTTGTWSKLNGRDFIGIENNPEVFEIAKKRLES